MTFRSVPPDGHPLKVVLVGVGPMGQAWLAAIDRCAAVELVGLVDLRVPAAQAVADGLTAPVVVGSDVVDVARRSGAQAVIDVTVPVAHHPVTTAALFAGLPVLGEKPVASTVAEGLSLAAAAEITGELFMVSQSRRYDQHLWALKDQTRAIGPVGVLTTEFFKAPHFGGFRDEMDHPLLLDMAIHQFDAARFLLGTEPVSVYCEEYNPPWSWYRGDAACTAIFAMTGGARYVFTGSWCSPGLQTSWNGTWRASGAGGTVCWDGDHPPSSQTVPPAAQDAGGITSAGEGIDGSLAEFVDALRSGTTPMSEVHDNVRSLAMVEAAISSHRTGQRVSLADVMDTAAAVALAHEQRDDVAAVLRQWQASGTWSAGDRVPRGA